MLYLHTEMSDVASEMSDEGTHWNFLIALATAGHSNPMFIWSDQKEDVSMLLIDCTASLLPFRGTSEW